MQHKVTVLKTKYLFTEVRIAKYLKVIQRPLFHFQSRINEETGQLCEPEISSKNRKQKTQ
jgi:hypothetical protein